MVKNVIRKILVISGLIVNLEISHADMIEVGGNVSGTWTAGNTYIATNTVTVPNGLKLVIEQGVIVKFATNTSLLIYGELIAIGTSKTITFTSNNPTPQLGDWDSIKFSGPQSKGTISYCLIEYGKRAIHLQNASRITILHNTIKNTKGELGSSGEWKYSGGTGGIGAGIYLYSATYNTIMDNIIYNNQGGQGGAGGNLGSGGRGGIGAGIYLVSSINNAIKGNTIYNSRRGTGTGNGSYGNGYGIYLDSNSYNNTIDSINTYNGEPIHYYYGITTPTIIEYQTLTIAGSESTNLGRIVLINCSNFTIKNNYVEGGIGENGETMEFMSVGKEGGVGAAIYLCSSTNNTITDNTICKNQGGKGETGGCGDGGSGGSGGTGGVGAGIYLKDSFHNTITANNFTNNQGGEGGTPGVAGAGGRGGIGAGIYLLSSTNNTLRGNIISGSQGAQGGLRGYMGSDGISGNGYGIYLDSNSYNNTIDSINTYNGEPIHYYYGITTPTIIEYQTLTIAGSGSTNLGRIVLINCSNFTIKNNFIAGGIGENGRSGAMSGSGEQGRSGVGIYLGLSTNNTITGNTICKNQGGEGGSGGYAGSKGAGGIGIGIFLSSSNNNEISNGNTIFDNQGGIGYPNGAGVGIYCKSSVISEIIYNNIYNNQTYNLQTDISPGTQTAEYNWWGADPPATYTFSGNIDYEPWLTTAVSKITIIPSSGTVGTFVTVSGEDFSSTELIRIDFGTTRTITMVTTNTSGTFTTVFTIDTQPYGYTTIAAMGINSNAMAYATFIIMPKVIMITPYWGTVGSIVFVNGNGFGVSESIRIDFGTTRTILITRTYAEGSFTTAFTVDTQPFGTTTIRAVGIVSGAEAKDRFVIMPNIISLTPNIGTVGSFVTIAGNGFGAMEGIRLDFGTTATIGNVTSSNAGSFTAVFTVNPQPFGTTSMAVNGLNTGSRVLALFKVVPKITSVLPTSGQVGSIVTVTGNGFGATELVCIDFGTTPTVTFASTNASGEFQVIFTADSQPIGTTTIIAEGLMSGGYAIAYFYILPATILKITPAEQNVALGSTWTTQVELFNVTRLFGGDIHLRFDPNILEVIGIGSGTFPANPMVVGTFSNITGWIRYGFFLFAPASATGSGIVCNIIFKGIAGGKSNVVFESEGNHETKLVDTYGNPIPFTKQEAFYRVIDKVAVYPGDTVVKAGDAVNYTGLAYYGTRTMDVTGSATFTASGGGSFTANTFLAKYIGTYTISGEYLGFIGTTSVIIIPGTPTTLVYVAGNNQVNTCTLTLKEPFIVKVVDSYGNPCPDVYVNWEIMAVPLGATGSTIFPTRTTTNIAGTASSSLTLGTEPPGTYTIYAISTGLYGSPYVFIAHSLRRFGNIAGYCLIDLGGTRTLGSISVSVKIVELNTTTTTQNSYFFFEKIPVGSYTLNLDTTGASPANVTGVRILATQFEDTTYTGTISLLAGDVQNDGQVNIEDWPVLADAWTISATETMTEWQTKYIEADFDHNGKVNIDDIYIFSQNFGRQQTTYRLVKKMKPTTSGKIELSFNLETLEGVDLENLRIGDIINLKVYVREAKGCLGGEVHLSFNPKVLQVVNEKVIPGDYPTVDEQNGRYKFPFKNTADNSLGVIDYAVGITAPEPGDGGLLVEVPFKIISNNAYSKIGCDFEEEENRQTMFIERSGDVEEPVDIKPEVLPPDEIIIRVPAVFNNLTGVRVYPNPAKKGQGVTFDQLTSDKWTTLRIYNLAGELVYEKEGENKITWDLKNKDGEDVASGIYIYFLKDELGATKKGKIGVIK